MQAVVEVCHLPSGKARRIALRRAAVDTRPYVYAAGPSAVCQIPLTPSFLFAPSLPAPDLGLHRGSLAETALVLSILSGGVNYLASSRCTVLLIWEAVPAAAHPESRFGSISFRALHRNSLQFTFDKSLPFSICVRFTQLDSPSAVELSDWTYQDLLAKAVPLPPFFPVGSVNAYLPEPPAVSALLGTVPLRASPDPSSAVVAYFKFSKLVGIIEYELDVHRRFRNYAQRLDGLFALSTASSPRYFIVPPAQSVFTGMVTPNAGEKLATWWSSHASELSVGDARSIFFQILFSLRAAESLGVAHLDEHSANVCIQMLPEAEWVYSEEAIIEAGVADSGLRRRRRKPSRPVEVGLEQAVAARSKVSCRWRLITKFKATVIDFGNAQCIPGSSAALSDAAVSAVISPVRGTLEALEDLCRRRAQLWERFEKLVASLETSELADPVRAAVKVFRAELLEHSETDAPLSDIPFFRSQQGSGLILDGNAEYEGRIVSFSHSIHHPGSFCPNTFSPTLRLTSRSAYAVALNMVILDDLIGAPPLDSPAPPQAAPDTEAVRQAEAQQQLLRVPTFDFKAMIGRDRPRPPPPASRSLRKRSRPKS